MDATVDKDTLKKALTMQPPKSRMRLRARSGEGGTVGQWHMPYYQKGTFIRAFYSEGKNRGWPGDPYQGCQPGKDTAARKALINWAHTIE